MKHKKLLLAICLFLMLATPLLAHEADSTDKIATIGGFGVGYVVDGPDETSVTTYYFAGARLKQISEGSAVYGVAHKYGIDESEAGGAGGRLIYAAEMKAVPSINILVGLGFLDNVAQDSDSTLVTGITVDGGFVWNLAERINVGCYGFGVDRGETFAYSVHAVVSVSDPFELLIGLIPGL